MSRRLTGYGHILGGDSNLRLTPAEVSPKMKQDLKKTGE